MGKERKEQAMCQPDKDGWVYLTEPVPVELCGAIEFQDRVRSMDGNATEWKRVDGLSMFVGFPHRVRFKRGWVKVTSKVPDSVMHLFEWRCQAYTPSAAQRGFDHTPYWGSLGTDRSYWLRLKDQSLGFPQDPPSPQPDLAQPDEPRCVIKDSGVREDFPTGSRRDTRKGKGRFDLLPWLVVEMDAKFIEQGAKKYGDRNWEKGQPLSRYQDSAARHLCKWLMGMRDEPHALAARWNLAAFIWTAEMVRAGKLPKELDDVGETGMNEKKEVAA